MTNERRLILVVDDEMDTRTFLYSLLDNEGYRVATCAEALEAIKYVARSKPDVVISDVRMPGIEGMELLAKVKQVSPKTHVILISAYGDWSMYMEALERGGDDLLLKPFTNEELLRTVGWVLQKTEA